MDELVMGALWALVSGLISLAISYKSYKKRSLSMDGAMAAFFVGFFTFFAGVRFAFILLFFFISSSMITNLGGQRKKVILSDFKKGGQRDSLQVFSNGLWPTLVLLVWPLVYACDYALNDAKLAPTTSGDPSIATVIIAAVVGHYACCCGDTWASELGVLATNPPRFVLPPFKSVPVGTNGGVTLMGLTASVAGGAGVGLAASFYDLVLFILGADITFSSVTVSLARLTILGAVCGLVGSLCDSILGATLQYSGLDLTKGDHPVVVNEPPKRTAQGSNLTSMMIGGHTHISGQNILTNNQVNAISSLITSFVAVVISLHYLDS